jgi:hypothetical protein
MKLVTVVAQNEDPNVASSLFMFADSLMTSTWFTAVGADYGVAPPTQSIHVTGAAITTNQSAQQMVSYIDTAIASNPAAANDGNTFYMLYLPEGIWDLVNGSTPNTDCQYHGGYHTVMGSGVPWGMGLHCKPYTRIQGLGVVGSHEIIEAASDPSGSNGWILHGNPGQPWLGSVWTSGSQGENGDMCTGTSIYVQGYKLQRIWSNTAAKGQGDPCLPALQEAFFNTSVPQQWYPVAAGASLQIPITGYSDKATSDWLLDVGPIAGNSNGFTATIASATTTTIQGMTLPTINNARTATLNVKAPAQSGAWAIFWIYSEAYPAGSDQFHYWPVGVHVQ